jgi:hypothetical protein
VRLYSYRGDSADGKPIRRFVTAARARAPTQKRYLAPPSARQAVRSKFHPRLSRPPGLLVDGRTGVLHGPGVWFGEEVREMTIFSEQYDFTVTLLLLEDRDRYIPLEPDPEPDTYDRFTSQR